MEIDNLIREGYELLNETTDWPAYEGGSLDRTKFVTSSEIWNCSRRIKFGKLLPNAAFPNWGWAERGNVIERWVIEQVDAALKQNYKDHTLLAAGELQVSFSDGAQSGTPDGILRYPDYSVDAWEVKSIDPRTARRNLPKEAHIWQIQQNMDLIEASMDCTVKGGRLIYVDASNLQDRVEEWVTPDPILMRHMQEKAERIMAAETAEELPAEGLYRNECKLCDYKSQCSAKVASAKEEAERMQQAQRAANGLFK